MRDLDYTIIEKRISRLERLITNEQLNQKNEFLGIGKKIPKADHSQLIIDIISEDSNFDYWKKYRMTRGWRDDSRPGYIDLSLSVSNNRTAAKQKVEYVVTLEGKDLKKIRLNITRRVRGEDEEVVVSQVVPLVTPSQIRKASDLIIDSIDRNEIS